MIDGLRVVAIIPARGGSKGIKDKNIINLCGKPLISYTIEAAKTSMYIDYVLVSTDSEKIAECARNYGAKVPFLRPAELAQDDSASIDVVIHALDYLENKMGMNFYYCVLLQPTSPLRRTEDIDEAVEKINAYNANSLVSVCEATESPYLMKEIKDSKMIDILEKPQSLRRQDLPKVYILNGALYINSISRLRKERQFIDGSTIPFIMDKNNSVDIDDFLDLKLAELILKERCSNEDRRL